MGYKSSYQKFKNGKSLTRKEAMEAQCYECNGYDIESSHDCLGVNCPLYQWTPWGESRGLRPVIRSERIDRRKSKAISEQITA